MLTCELLLRVPRSATPSRAQSAPCMSPLRTVTPSWLHAAPIRSSTHHYYVGRGESERGWAGEKERNEMEVTEREAAVVERELGGIGRGEEGRRAL